MNVRGKILVFLREVFPSYSVHYSEDVWIYSHIGGEQEEITWYFSIIYEKYIYQGSSQIDLIDALKDLYLSYYKTNPEYYQIMLPKLSSFIEQIKEIDKDE